MLPQPLSMRNTISVTPGDPGASFQAKVNTVIDRLGLFDKLEGELREINIKPEDARKIREEMQEGSPPSDPANQR